jgi:hypothetical protein
MTVRSNASMRQTFSLTDVEAPPYARRDRFHMRH